MRHRPWHLSGWPAVLLAPVAIPVVLLGLLVRTVLGRKRTADLTAADVESYLEDFVEGRGADFDWDDFTTIPITDPALNAVRERAASIPLPRTEGSRTEARHLLQEFRGQRCGPPAAGEAE